MRRRAVQATGVLAWFTPGWARPDRVRQHSAKDGRVYVVRPRSPTLADQTWQLLCGSTLLRSYEAPDIEAAVQRAESDVLLHLKGKLT